MGPSDDDRRIDNNSILPDAELVNRVRNGDTRAFDILYARYQTVALQKAAHLLGNQVEAEDVVQRAMYTAYAKLPQLVDPSRFGRWLSRIVQNTAIDLLRERSRRRRHEVPDSLCAFLPKHVDHGESAINRWLDAAAIEDAISILSPAMRDVFRLRAHEHLTIAEIAAKLGVPIGTVKRRLHDATKKIRRNDMPLLDQPTAETILSQAAEDIKKLPNDIRRDIRGVAVGGDLPRGDFLENNSSLLIFALFTNRESLFIYETKAYRKVAEIFDRHFRPYIGCAESPNVWENLAFDDVHLPKSAENFDPPDSPQPQWHSFFLFDLIDHHAMLYGDDFIKTLYRPDPRNLTIRMAAATLGVMQSGRARPNPPVGFNTVTHWWVLKMVQVLQIHFSPSEPTIAKGVSLSRYLKYVPEFPLKEFGKRQWKAEINAQYPADRKEHSDYHAKQCKRFVREACSLIQKHAR